MATTRIRSSNQLYIDNSLDLSGFRIYNLATPTGSTDAVNKAYVDGIQSGLDIKESVKASSISNLTVTTGTTTLTNADTQQLFSIDGVTGFSINDRILIKDQVSKQFNGIYTITNLGSPSTNWVLTRASDFDNTPSVEVTSGAFCFVEEGTINSDSGWVLTTNGPISIGVTPLTFTQFSGAGQVEAGNGLTKLGNRMDVVSTGDGSLLVSEDSINLPNVTVSQTNSGANTKFFDTIGIDSFGRVTSTHVASIPTGSTSSAGLSWFDDSDFDVSGSGLVTLNVQSITPGVYGSNTAIPVVQVNHNGIITGITTQTISTTLNISGDTGSDGISLANDTLTFAGVTGISTSINPATNKVTISGVAATTTTLGVASFNTNNFTVSSGAVTAKDIILGSSTLTLGNTTPSIYGLTNLTVTGTSSFGVIQTSSSTLVSNLNADLLDGNHATYFVNTGITVTAGSGLTGGGNLANNITISHADTSSASNISSDNSNGVVIQDITVALDGFGHVTGATVGTADLDGRYYTETEADNRFVNVAGDTMTGNLIINGNLTVTGTSSFGVIQTSSSTLVSNLNADLLDGKNASDITGETLAAVPIRKYRLASSSASGTSVVFSFAGINSGNITIDTLSYELFKNGLLQNDGAGGDYTVIAPNYTADTITFTVNPAVISDAYPDVFLLNFTYTK